MATGARDHFKAMQLYGLYEDEPIPLACDEQGRLILVIQGTPIWDPSGTVLIHDTFVDGLTKCLTEGAGTGWAVALDTAEAVEAAQSCRITGGSTLSLYARITYWTTPRAYNKIGVECALRVGDNADKFYIHLLGYTGDYFFNTRIGWYDDDDAWKLMGSDQATLHTILGNTHYFSEANNWRRFKLVIDLENFRYHSFKHPGGTVDLTAYGIYKSANATAPYIKAQFTVVSDSGSNGWCLADDIRITQDET